MLNQKSPLSLTAEGVVLTATNSPINITYNNIILKLWGLELTYIGIKATHDQIYLGHKNAGF